MPASVPVPSHLRGFVLEAEWLVDRPGVECHLGTPQGSIFDVAYDTFGDRGPLYPGNACALTVRQRGYACEVFDISRHGYDALVVGYRPNGLRLAHRWWCEACGCGHAEVRVTLMYSHWEADGFRSTAAKEDCFDGVVIDLTCAACAARTPEFVEHEMRMTRRQG